MRLAPITAALLSACSLAGCVLGSESTPGCRLEHPEDCESGWVCRSGLCVHPTTSLTDPEAGVDAGEEAATKDASQESDAAASDVALVDAPVEPEVDAGQDAGDDAPSESGSDAQEDGAEDAPLE